MATIDADLLILHRRAGTIIRVRIVGNVPVHVELPILAIEVDVRNVTVRRELLCDTAHLYTQYGRNRTCGMGLRIAPPLWR